MGGKNLQADNPTTWSITDALTRLRDRQISVAEYIAALTAACDAHKDLNAFTSWDHDRLRDDAEKVDAAGNAGQGLAGIPICFKDNINTATLTTGGGTGAMKNWQAPGNAPVAQALFNKGALLGAKGNMHELAFGITTNNAVTGAVHNPWNKAMIPGGSSGGIAAAVAAGMMPGGIGTDTGASVRLPASLCGVVGFRPTVGRYSSDGIIPISLTRDTAGPITRTVADTRLLDAVMAGTGAGAEIPAANTIRLGVSREYFFGNLDPAVADNATDVLDRLAGAGIELVVADIPDLARLDEAVSFPVVLFEFMRDLPAYLEQYNVGLTMQQLYEGIGSPDVKGLFGSQMGDEAMPEAVYQQAMTVDRPALQQTYADYFASHNLDAVVFPTSPLPARPTGDDETVELNGERVPTFPTFIRNTDPGSNAAIPGISLPCGLTPDGLPLGMELDGPAGSDERLLGVAAAIEPILDFSARPDLG